MSYESENFLKESTSISLVREVVSLLGYSKAKIIADIDSCVDSMMWFEHKDYQSWSGIELSVLKENEMITVYTRSGSCRSYWDLIHQNKTIKILRDLFGGHFKTDAGQGRYWRPDEEPPTPIQSGCYLARWRFHNSLMKTNLYLDQRGMNGQIARETSTGLDFIDEINPRFLSNNLLLPYFVAIWEDYLKSTFTVLLRYSKSRKKVLKRARLSDNQIESIIEEKLDIELAIADSLSFQRATKASENFKLLDSKIDIAGALRKPYKRRKVPLYESIEACIELRNEFVHTGKMDTTLTDERIKRITKDFEVAIDRVYDLVGERFGFTPLKDY